MLHFTSDQFVQWLGIYFWPMLRIMALISTAPILSEKSVPKRVKIGLGMVITIIVAPSLPAVDIPIFSPNAIWIALQQVMIGVAVGFTMQLAFAAVRTAGELIGLQMGLSFATFVDPGSHLNMPVLARIIDLLAMLLFSRSTATCGSSRCWWTPSTRCRLATTRSTATRFWRW